MADEGLVLRPRLFDILSGGRGLRVVAAPSGFGKTTLLRSWVDARPSGERTLVWVALSARVASRRDFWLVVAASAARRGHLDAGAFRALTGRIETLDDPVDALVELLGGFGPTLLVIDAYEHLRGLTDVDDDLVRLAAVVEGLEIVVTTRASTGLVDDVLMLRGVVRVIDEADLRFTADEVAELLALHAPHAVSAAERVVQDTHGYPLGVRAAAHALGRLGSVPAFDGAGWRRLVSEDLRSQIADPALADFVLDTSVPPYFDRDLARQLTRIDDVDSALAELAWNGFGRWIPYAPQRPAFQYVESVRDVFLEQLRADRPGRYERDAGIAAAWLHRDGDHDLALSLAIEARQFGLASSICRSLVMSNPDVYATDLFDRHLRRVPRMLLPRYPVLAFIRGMVCASNPATRAAAAEYFRIVADHALDHLDALTSRETFYQLIGWEVSLRYLGRSAEAAAAAEAALAHFESMSDADRDELGDFRAMALSIIAYSLFQTGEIDRAGAVVERAAMSAVAPWWRNYALGFVVSLHALNGRCSDAQAALSMVVPDASHSSGRQRRLPFTLEMTGRAAVLLDDFDFAGALRAYEEPAVHLDAAESWPFITWVMIHARLGLGEVGAEAHRVAEALAAKPLPLGIGPNLGTAALTNALAILWLADGRAAQARTLLEGGSPLPGQLAPGKLLHRLVTGDATVAVREVADLLALPGHTVRSTAAVDTLGAAAALRTGNADIARAFLERAASRYQLFGVRAHLLYVPARDLDALRDLASVDASSVCRAYVEGVPASSISPVESAPVRLTKRETEVLRAWAKHRTKADVARALFVSTNTVRSQLNSAYRKLGVTTKDAAIQRSIELDLLRPPSS